MTSVKIAILVGSDSDLPVVAAAAKVLDEFQIPYRLNIASAHRTPEKVRAIVKEAEQQGAEVFIAGAGMSAALPGVVAAETVLPVIGIPMEGKAAGSMDALLSVTMMPPGIPVAGVAVGKAGATNAALLAVAILAVKDAGLKEKLVAYRRKMASAIMARDEQLQKMGLEKYIESQKK